MNIKANLHNIAQAIYENRLLDAGRLIDETVQHIELPKDLNYHIFINASIRYRKQR